MENRKKSLQIIVLVLIALFFSYAPTMAKEETMSGEEGLPVEKEAGSEESADAEWTVLFYMCGSDLETKSGMASFNLHEIMCSAQPSETVRVDAGSEENYLEEFSPRVNILIETGGARTWHNMEDGEDWGVSIASDRLQRHMVSHDLSEGGYYPLTLVEEQPQQCMADPETLTDFIRWGTETCPAEKYMLILWGHGSGSSSGMIIDELYDNNILCLHELGQALEKAGVHFEAVLLDACLMGSLETAVMLQPYADWMIGSEELSSGYGTAFRQWLVELFRNPDIGGGQIGTYICDATEAKYGGIEDDQSQLLYTWSVVDLSRIGRVQAAFDRLFEFVNERYSTDAHHLPSVLAALEKNVDKYGTGNEYMRDLGTSLFNDEFTRHIDRDIRNELADALYDAVIYSVTGDFRSHSYGLSYCYPPDAAPEVLDSYAANCKSAPYLAFLDAASVDWTAPDWVYEKTRRLTPREEIPLFCDLPELGIENGMPLIRGSYEETTVWKCFYELYRMDDYTEELYRLGTDEADYRRVDEDTFEYTMDDPGDWPTIDDELCDIEFCDIYERSGYYMSGPDVYLYDVPIQIGAEVLNLRIGQWTETDDDTGEGSCQYKVYGLSQSFHEDSGMPGRFAEPVSELEGQEYALLYPVYTDEPEEEGTFYGFSEPMSMYRTLTVKEKPLPEGTYFCDFVMENCFGQRARTDLVELYWDGTEWQCPS